MNKLAGKFILSMSAILLLVILFSLYINAHFVERYFLFAEKRDLNSVCEKLVEGRSDLAGTIALLEENEEVVIAWVEGSDDNDLLNTRLKSAFLEKGLGMDSYWLWDQDQLSAAQDGRKLRIYRQEKLNYSLMVEYVDLGIPFIAVAKVIPSLEETISLINGVTALVFSTAALVMIGLLCILVKKITAPLAAIGQTARSIADLDFKTIRLKTGDELENLANDVSDMSDKLKAAHQELESKNRQMQSLLINVSHDLKTPVSLIKAYTSGIKDGMDDGTFLDTVILQNEKMAHMIERLLDFAKLQQQIPLEKIDVSLLLEEVAAEYTFQAQNRGLVWNSQIEPGLICSGSHEVVYSIFSNLLSNAVQYASGGSVDFSLTHQGESAAPQFVIENNVQDGSALEISRLWEPFYVGEPSRDKNMSGTGLGLSIVQTATQKYGYVCSCSKENNTIRFTVTFQSIQSSKDLE